MSLAISLARRAYDMGWFPALPFLEKNHRLQEGWDRRVLNTPLPQADLWIQAASGGEAYLALEILKKLSPRKRLRVLATTNTSQGLSVLNSADFKRMEITTSYFPFDQPRLMDEAVAQVRPKVVVTLESEIWPGLFSALKRTGAKLIIANGRMTSGSLARYLLWPSLWRAFRPDRVLAMSDEDARRFQALFGRDVVRTVPNIKFDRIGDTPPAVMEDTPIRPMIPPDTGFMVLGSVREREETDCLKMLARIRARRPQTITGLFPRHMHRVASWQGRLTANSIPWTLRSWVSGSVRPGTVIIWDKFGELTYGYAAAKAAFVGGSLAPLGGQNFLEPLTVGVKPVIGPHWKNFAWVGRDIVESGLVKQVPDWRAAADALLDLMDKTPSPDSVRAETLEYVRSRKGGTKATCAHIAECLD